jgi:hypothetical protein
LIEAHRVQVFFLVLEWVRLESGYYQARALVHQAQESPQAGVSVELEKVLTAVARLTAQALAKP